MDILTLILLAGFCNVCTLCLNPNDEDIFDTLLHENVLLTFRKNENVVMRLDDKLEIQIGKHKQGLHTSYRECNDFNLKLDFVFDDSVEKVLCLTEVETSVEIYIAFEKLDKSVNCVNIYWTDMTNWTDCVNMEGQSWYGGGELFHQHWPMKNVSFSATPFVTGDFLSGSFFGPVVENLWLGSNGVSIFVERDAPLMISINNSVSGQFCLSTDNKHHPYKSLNMQSSLKYSVCASKNIRDAYAYASKRWITKPKTVSSTDIFLPIWSTWAKYKADINQSLVERFSHDIFNHGFKKGIVEIDDQWETCYGDLTFNHHKFPNPRKMISNIKLLGFKVTLWVHPFVNKECEDYLTHNEYFVRNGTAPNRALLVRWWNGIGGYIDFTNPSARSWMARKLQYLKDHFGVDGFKWDAGEIMWLRDDFLLHDNDIKNPNKFSKIYSEFANSFDGPKEVRVGADSQSKPTLLRMLDKMSRWDYSGGLRTIIPTALLFSLYGYSFVLPDMIGGNNYNSSAYPDKNLFIRWFQAVLFFPALQFSIAPWDYDDETVSIVRNNLQIREKYMPLFEEILEKTKNGTMIINPLWTASPSDTVAQNIDSEFLVGNVLLVAPVLEKDALFRNIYLPKGSWEDILRGKIITGPVWLTDYTVHLHEIALFLKT